MTTRAETRNCESCRHESMGLCWYGYQEEPDSWLDVEIHPVPDCACENWAPQVHLKELAKK